jgi:hypothetical protein
MTSADRNDLMPAQEKLEWVTPKISLMEAEETNGGKPYRRYLEYYYMVTCCSDLLPAE